MKKRKLIPLPPKPTFAMTGIAVGVGTGLIAGFIAELTWRHSVLMMQAGGIAGITVGGIFEAAR